MRFSLPAGGWLKGVAGRPKHLPLLVLALVAALAFAWRASTDAPVRLAVRTTPEVSARMTQDGRTALFLTARISAPPGVYKLSGRDRAGEPLELKGDIGQIVVGKEGTASVRFALVADSPSVRAVLSVEDEAGKTLRTVEYETVPGSSQ